MPRLVVSTCCSPGVLEPAGIVAIKYRQPELVKTANRLDQVLVGLHQQLIQAKRANDTTAVADLGEQIAVRQKNVLGTYLQIATHFADLHDTPGRMEAKNVIHGTVPWRRSRSFFYWRLRRRLAEFALRKHVQDEIGANHVVQNGGSSSSKNTTSLEQCSELIKQWFVDSQSKTTPTTTAQPAWKQYAFSGNSFASNGTGTGSGNNQERRSSEDMRWVVWLG